MRGLSAWIERHGSHRSHLIELDGSHTTRDRLQSEAVHALGGSYTTVAERVSRHAAIDASVVRLNALLLCGARQPKEREKHARHPSPVMVDSPAPVVRRHKAVKPAASPPPPGPTDHSTGQRLEIPGASLGRAIGEIFIHWWPRACRTWATEPGLWARQFINWFGAGRAKLTSIGSKTQ